MVDTSPNNGGAIGSPASAGGPAGAPASRAGSAVPVAGPDGDAAPAEHGAGAGPQPVGPQPPGFADWLQQEVQASNQALAKSINKLIFSNSFKSSASIITRSSACAALLSVSRVVYFSSSIATCQKRERKHNKDMLGRVYLYPGKVLTLPNAPNT